MTRNRFDDDGDVGDSDGNDVGDLSRTLDVTKIVKKSLPVNFFEPKKGFDIFLFNPNV